MGYFGECKGTQTPDERRAEADRIIKILNQFVSADSYTDTELRLLENMDGGTPVSPKQLLWLRDIKTKYAE